MNIYLDIETIPCQSPDLIAMIGEGVKPPATMSKPETIAKWEAESKSAAIEQAVLNTSFDGALGMIAMIGIAIDDYPVEILCSETALTAKAWAAAESDALRALSDRLAAAVNSERPNERGALKFIGHNILGFDLRFLWQRLVINSVSPSRYIPFGTRYSGERVYDTMTEWNPDRQRSISLDKLCRVLRVPTPKASMGGADVWPKLSAGQVSEVVEYCRGDIEALRSCYKRMTFA
jgi:hypothetical protein